MSMESVIFLPETVVTDLLGRDLPASVGQEFDYNGKRYKVRQRDPARSEGGVPCELVEPSLRRKSDVAAQRAADFKRSCLASPTLEHFLQRVASGSAGFSRAAVVPSRLRDLRAFHALTEP